MMHKERFKLEKFQGLLHASRMSSGENSKNADPSMLSKLERLTTEASETKLRIFIKEKSALLVAYGGILDEHMEQLCATALPVFSLGPIMTTISPDEGEEFWDLLEDYAYMLKRVSELNALLEIAERELGEHEALYDPADDMYYHVDVVNARTMLQRKCRILRQEKTRLWELHHDDQERLLHLGQLFKTCEGGLPAPAVKRECFSCSDSRKQVNMPGNDDRPAERLQQTLYTNDGNETDSDSLSHDDDQFVAWHPDEHERNYGGRISDLEGSEQAFYRSSSPLLGNGSIQSLDQGKDYMHALDADEEVQNSPPSARPNNGPRPSLNVQQNGVHSYGDGRSQNDDRRYHGEQRPQTLPGPPPAQPRRQELIEIFGYENKVTVNGDAAQRYQGLHIYIAGHNNKVVVGHE